MLQLFNKIEGKQKVMDWEKKKRNKICILMNDDHIEKVRQLWALYCNWGLKSKSYLTGQHKPTHILSPTHVLLSLRPNTFHIYFVYALKKSYVWLINTMIILLQNSFKKIIYAYLLLHFCWHTTNSYMWWYKDDINDII